MLCSLEACCGNLRTPLPRERKPTLCYVTSRRALERASAHSPGDPVSGKTTTDPTHALLETIRKAAAAGINWIQIREKDLGTLIVSMSRSPRALRVFIWANCRCRWKRWRIGGAPPSAWNFGSAHRAIRWKRRARPKSLALTTSSSGPFLRRRQKQNSARRKESGGSARCAARCPFQCSRSAASVLKMLIRVLPQVRRAWRQSGCFRNPKMYRPS